MALRKGDLCLSPRGALAQIGHINVEVKYLPGPKNATADWLSRYQLLGRNEFSTSGFSKALGGLLRQLLRRANSCAAFGSTPARPKATSRLSGKCSSGGYRY